MWMMIFIALSGVSASFSIYMAFLAFKAGDDGAYFFTCVGILFGILFLSLILKTISQRIKFLKRVDEKISGGSEPAAFVPHTFMMWAIIIAAIGIAAAITIPIFYR
jgi:hypothetical protein